MSWTSPTTYVAGAVLTAAQLNTSAGRDNEGVLKTLINNDGTHQTLWDVSVTEQDVVSSVTETAVYSKSIVGGTLSTTRPLRLQLFGSYFNNTGSPDTFAVRVKFGATTIATNTGISLTNTGSRYPFFMEVLINPNNATNAQRSTVKVTIGPAEAEAALGAVVGGSYLIAYSTSALDTTSAQTLQVTVQHTTSSASISFKRYLALLERLVLS